MKSTKRIISLVLCVLTVLVLAAASVSCTAADSTKALFEKALGRTLDEAGGLEILSTLSSIAGQGSVEIGIKSNEEDFPIGGSVKIYASSDKKKTAVKLSATADDKALEAFAFADEDKIMVKCDDILGKTYGINLKKFEENFEKSVFNPDSDSEFALSEEAYNAFLDAIDLFRKEEKTAKDTAKVLKKAEKEFYKAIEANAELTKEKTTVDILGYDDVKATLVKISVDNEGLGRAIESLWKKMKTDKDFKNWIGEYVVDNSSIADKLDVETVGDVIDKIDDPVDDIVESIEDNEFTLTLSLYLNKQSGAVMRADIAVKADGEKQSVSVELGNKFKTFEGFKLTLKSDDESRMLYLKVVEDTKDELKVKLDQNIDSDIPEISLKYDRTDGDLTITAKDEYPGGNTTGVLKLNYKEKSGTHTVKFVSVSRNGEKADVHVDITVTLKEKDSVPAPEKFTELITLGEEEMTDFIDTVEDNFSTHPFVEEYKNIFFYDIFG